jgi:soluble lytic murein transglycosylase-like protein
MNNSRLTTARAAIGLSLAFLQVASATAATIEFTEGGRNARTSLNFRGESNVLTTVPKGTEGDVLETHKFLSGNYGIKLKIKKLGAGRTSLKADEEIWVYYNKDHSPYIALYDGNGRRAKTPEVSTKSVVTKSFRTQKSLAKKVVVCTNCNANGVAQKQAAPIKEEQTKTLSDISDISDNFTNGDIEGVNAGNNGEIPGTKKNLAPENNFAVEELVSFMKKSKTAPSDATLHKIAGLTLKEAQTQRVPISLVLAVQRWETRGDYDVSATSGKGARGLMQIMPSTYADIRYGISTKSAWNALSHQRKLAMKAELRDLPTNIHYGVKYLKELLHSYKNNPLAAAAAYNGGPSQAYQVLRGERLSKKETRNYVPAIRKYIADYDTFESVSGTKLGTLIAQN